MDFQPQKLGNLLSSYVNATQPTECEKLMDKLQSLLAEELPENTLDMYIINIFHTSSGLLQFIEQTHSLQNCKIYQKARTAAFKVLYILLNNFPQNVVKYSSFISRTCVTIACSYLSSSYEKDQALKVIMLMLGKQLFGGDMDDVVEIYTRLLNCRMTNKGSTAEARAIEVFGLIAKTFPIVISDSADELFDYILNRLEEELAGKKSKLMIAGCLCMIRDFFVNYAPETGSLKILKVYKCLKAMADPTDQARKFANRDAIQVLQTHSSLFGELLFNDRKWWHGILKKYLNLGLEEKKVGSAALESFYIEVAAKFKDSPEQREVLEYLKYFTETFEDNTKNNFEIRAAIRGLGIFSDVFKICLEANEILKLFISIMRKVEHDYVITEPDYDILSFLPVYIQTIASLTGALDFITENQILCFQKMLILMVRTFPKLSQVYHELVVQVFVKTLYQIERTKKSRGNFLAVIVRHGIIWSCSHPYPLNSEDNDDENKQNTSYKSYLPLWSGLLKVLHSRKFHIQSNLEKETAEKFFDEFIITLLFLVNKLNLEVKPKEDFLVSSNPATAYDVVQISDYEIYLNVVDFYVELLQNADGALFTKWMQMYINEMIVKSVKQPFNSGFYKLLAASLKISDEINYFSERKQKEDIETCFESVQTFIKNMLLKMKQFNGELQIACLQLLLQAPCVLISELLPLTAPAFLTLFSIGRSYFHLVHMGLQTLTRWKNNLPEANMNAFLEQVIPPLDAYLRSKSLQNTKTKPLPKTRKTKQILNKVKILVETEPELFKLQKAILTFVSQLSSDLCYVFVNANSCVDPGTFITHKHLKIDLHYEDCLISVHLDGLVPRVLELALYCSNRKIRMTACELLHSIVMVLLGTRRKMDVEKHSELDAIFEKLVKASLSLGCDLDEPIQKLFEPLVLSLIRWFTHWYQVGTKHTEILIEALMDGITQPTDPSLRDFCGKCIKELTIWTLKHMERHRGGRRENETSNIKVLVQRIISYSLHCDPSKKLGAALIFNNIYTVLREEDTLLNMYWIEILYAFVMSLEMTEANLTEDTCYLEQVNQALNHVQRVLVEKSNIFNKVDPDRRLPPHFKGGLMRDVGAFLFKHCGSRKPHCRAKCMEFFCEVRPLIEQCDNCDSRKECLHVAEGIQSFYEADLLERPKVESFYDIFEWFLDFYRALDGYIFIVQNGFIEKNDIKQSSTFFVALKYFLNNLAAKNLKQVITTSSFTVTEREAFSNLKLKVVLKSIDFVVVLLKKEVRLQEFWSDCLPKLICNVVFEPQCLGIEINDINTSHKQTVLNLLQLIKNTLPQTLIANIENVITTYVISKQLAPTNFKRNVPLKQRLLVKGIILLHESRFSTKINLPDIVKQVFEVLFENDDVQVKVVNTFDDTFKSYYEAMLQLAFFNDVEKKTLVDCFFNASPVNVLNSYKTTTCGRYFFELFKSTVIPKFLEDFNVFLNALFAQNKLDLTIEYITEFLDYIDDNKSSIQRERIKSACELILQNWSKLHPFFNENFVNLQQGLDFVKKLAHIVPFPAFWIGKPEYSITKWIIASIMREDLQLPFEVIFNFRAQVYELFSCISGMSDEEHSELRRAFKFLQTSYYEKETELTQQSIILSLNKLLDVLKVSRSKIILEGFSEIYAVTVYDTKNLNVEDALTFYMRQIDSQSQLKSLEIVYKLSLEKNTMAGYRQANVIFQCLLQNCNKPTFENFVKKYMSDIVSFIKENSRVIEKIVAFIITEILFFRIDFLKCESVCREIEQGANTEQNLIKFVASQAIHATKEETNGTPELFRLYQCQAYKALVSVISNTKRDIKQYNLLFVRENAWNHLIDPAKHYTFEPTFENAIPAYRNKFVSIRNEARALKRSRGLYTASVKYSESQSLFNSTLSEDISKFDFTNTILRTDDKVKDAAVEEVLQQDVALETIEINNHECMATICGLIEFMVESEISPLDVVTSPPQWMKGILQVLNSETAHKNAKLLLVKVIHNTEHVFKSYSKWFLPAIVKLICGECFGGELNYFIYDLVTMLLEWSKRSVPIEESNICSQLLAFLMHNVDNDVKAIYKMNRELIRTVLEVWKLLLTIPHQFLFERLKLPADSKKLASTIDLIHDVLLNKLEAWDKAQIQDFLIALCKVFITNKNKSVYQEAAKASGLALALLESKEETEKYVSKLTRLINEKLLKINDEDRLLYCLEGLTANYPQIVDRYLCRLISDLNTVQGTFKNIILKILALRHVQLQSVTEFSWLDYETLLRDVDTDVQILTLELIRDYLPHYNDSDLLKVLQIVVKVVNNTNITCREIMYEILTKCLQHCAVNEQIQSLCKSTLIDGLSDQNTDIQEKVFTYCSKDLSQKLHERMLALLCDYYKPSKENDYLNCAVYLLFDLLKQNNSYKSIIFDQPLHQCTFEEYKLYGHWRAQHASVVPLFANTLRSQMTQQGSFSSVDLNVIRATQQSLAFEPTQVEDKNEPLGIDQEFKDPNKLQLSQRYKMSRYRFYKDKEKVSRHFALQEVKKASKREQARRDLAKEKERGVTFYRQYKRGDFPDIQIELKDVLLPLQILAKHDSEIAKTVFTLMLESLIQKSNDSSDFIEKIAEATNKIFNSTFQYNPSVMAAFLELAIQHKDTMKIQPELIATACQSSGLISTGITIFEEYLLASFDVAEPVTKKMKTTGSLENDCWVYLSELYKQMDEFDVVKGILVEKLSCPEDHLEAIKAETDGNWKEALEAYENLITNDTESQYRKELYYESYFKCFASLSDWGSLSENIEASTENNPWDKFWDQDWYQKKVMPWYLKSELKNILINPARTKKLMNNLNECLKDSEKREYLKTNFSEELAMFWLLNDDEEEAKMFLRCNVLQFLEKWSNLSTLFSKARFAKLLNVRNVIDVGLFIKELTEISSVLDFEDRIESLKKLFLASVSDGVVDLDVFESRILYEQKFVDVTAEKLKQIINYDTELEEIINDLKGIKNRLNNALIEAGLKQNNFYVARKYFIQQQNLATDSSSNFKLMTSKIALLKARFSEGTSKSKLLLESWGYIEPILLANSTEAELKVLTYQHLFNITKQLAHSQLDLDTLRTKTLGFDLTKEQDVALYGLEQLKSTIDALCGNSEVTKIVAKAYVDIAYFAHKSEADLTDYFIMSILRSMKLGLLEGVQLFPCILNTEELGTTYRELFVTEAKDVPVWMFLRWIPQLLANVDSEKVFAVADIVDKIAVKYPQAIMYPYRLSKENYFLANANTETLKLIARLDKLLLNDDLVNLFLKALSCVSMPPNILRYYLNNHFSLARDKTRTEFNTLVDSVIKDVYTEEPDSRDVTKFLGNAFKTIKEFKSRLESLKKEKDSQKRLTIMKKLDDDLKTALQAKRRSLNLKDYCPWLANFHSVDFGTVLEIPGQYTGLKKPLPQYHVKIAGFHPKVSLMSSLRTPIKVTILGNDAKEYSYLVKFGEDLRQDQRIEQLFDLMNDIFRNDYESSLNHLSIVTYQVVPLTNKLGVIEWVENADVFTKLIKDQLNQKHSSGAFNLADKDYKLFSKTVGRKYNGKLAKCPRDDVIPVYQQLVRHFPDDLLRSSIRNLSSHLESFVALKNNFIKSYAVMCAAHWFLGIGDRHLENSMVSFKNAEVIGIDFGHAFGSSTQILAYPELVPFRLTPYIVNLLEPLGTNGLFKETIIKTLKAFRRSSDPLLSTMEVFVREPSLDWEKYAGKFENIHGFTKVFQAKRKLEGINPVECIVHDLLANASIKDTVDNYIEIVKGEPQYDVRARKGSDLLSVEEQVDCLLDLATDRNVLGRMYPGYQPWI